MNVMKLNLKVKVKVKVKINEFIIIYFKCQNLTFNNKKTKIKEFWNFHKSLSPRNKLSRNSHSFNGF
jgi:hypothetical protein